jgi:hypothetical protein
MDRITTRFARAVGVGVKVGNGVSVGVAVRVAVNVGVTLGIEVCVAVGEPSEGTSTFANMQASSTNTRRADITNV